MKDRMIERLFYWISGGRPMQFICPGFTDVVSDNKVSLWRDRNGRFWLAEGPWSSFRVADNEPKAWFEAHWPALKLLARRHPGIKEAP